MATPGRRTVRILGFVLIFCGLFLIVIMGLLLSWMSDMLANPGLRRAGGSTFNGTPDQAWWITRLFWTVLGFGVLSLAAGTWQVITARRDRLVTIIMVFATIVLMLMTWRTVTLLG